MPCSIHKLYQLKLELIIPKAIMMHCSASKAKNMVIFSLVLGRHGEKHDQTARYTYHLNQDKAGQEEKQHMHVEIFRCVFLSLRMLVC